MTDTTATTRILVGLDGSTLAETILPMVRALARRVGGEIALLHVVHLPIAVPVHGGLTIDEIVAEEEHAALTYLRRIAAELEGDGVAVRTAVAIGDTVPEIVRFAERESIDLVALATHGRSGVQRWLYGSVADGVLHAVTRPLLLLRPRAEAAPSAIDRVVVALDGSPLAEDALPTATALARRLGVPLALLRVVDAFRPAFVTAPYGGTAYDRILATLEADADHYLAAVARRERAAGLSVEALRATGAPAEALAQHSQTHPRDLLVLATHGRTGWRAAVIGSVARRVVLLTGGPVLMVRATKPAA
jgi:nucleotide-binding universal stress UspA family protein